MDISYIFHEGRQHGLTPAIMKKLEEDGLPDFLIIPDASSNDLSQHTYLKSKGVDILILDHHDVSEESLDAVVISNHEIISPDYTNRELTGAGITLKFLEALDEEYGLDSSKNYYSLAAVGIVADMVTILHPETRYYVYEGLKNVKNPMIRELIYKNAYHALNEAYPKIVSWNISNYMNAAIRMGTYSDKIALFRALLGEEELLHREYKYRGEEREKTEELHQTAYRLATNARNRQNTLKKKLIAEIKTQVDEQNLNDNSFVILALDEFREGFSGFVAGDLVNTYRKPVLITSWNEEEQVYAGSLRGYDSVMPDTRKYLDELGLFELVKGHSQAAGVAMKKENIQKINDKINKDIGDSTTSIEVDFEINSKSLTESLVRSFDEYTPLWCKGFDTPLVAIKDVEINCSTISFGYPMRFTVNGVEMLSFQIDERLQELAEEDMVAVCDIVGSLEINHYRGDETPQVMIEAIGIKSTKEDPFGGFSF